MPEHKPRKITAFKKRFNLVSAEESLLIPFIESIINNGNRLSCLYICGIYPRVFPVLCRENPFHLRRVANPYQVLTILSQADQRLVIIEHDPSIFVDAADVAEEIGKRCNELGRDLAILYFWPHPDREIRDRIERYSGLIVDIFHADPGRPAPDLFRVHVVSVRYPGHLHDLPVRV